MQYSRGKRGIEIAKYGIFQWYKTNKFKTNKYWDSEISASRILNLIYNFDFINSISSKRDYQEIRKNFKN